MRWLSVLPALAWFALPLQHVQAQAAAGSLLVISKADHTLALVDPATLKVKAKAPVGDDPHEVIASADGRTAWVSNYGYGAYHTLTPVDLTTMKALSPIDLGPLGGPHGLAFGAGETWFTTEGAKAVGRLQPSTGKVDLVIGNGQNRTHMIWVSPDAKHIIATNVNSGTLSFIDQVPPYPVPQGATVPHRDPDWNQTVVRVGNGSEGFDVSPDGREVWTENTLDHTVSVVDIASKSVAATIPIDAPTANRVKFTPDGRYVLVSAGPELLVLDAHSRTIFKRVPVGHGSAGLLVDPGGRRAFIACNPDSYVAVVDLGTFAVTAHLDVGGKPDGMAWAPAQ